MDQSNSMKCVTLPLDLEANHGWLWKLACVAATMSSKPMNGLSSMQTGGCDRIYWSRMGLLSDGWLT
ncbi:hypothetical protein BCR44DRAFT_1021659 [Catenaria anguillulae PL171]|uniref:Uncharacterized protein n=1 Tax=Catenaria anguillulae PL171 TaxID=765915 RepID=A0A1Y2H7X3_9FUNG|nr:hypothetical protein BCR44DRAFT_1021659 [Catenaria anguillulae PL171]